MLGILSTTALCGVEATISACAVRVLDRTGQDRTGQDRAHRADDRQTLGPHDAVAGDHRVDERAEDLPPRQHVFSNCKQPLKISIASG
eukprot:SAG22_NODE_122_length_18920_cov_23.494076_11_plen_88_part_00